MTTVWPQTASRPSGILHLGGCSANELAAEYGTPLYVIDEETARNRARTFRESFTTAFEKIGAAVDIYYAGKALLTSHIARWMHEEGLRIDVASAGELAIAGKAEIPAAHLTLHGNNKSSAEIAAALDYQSPTDSQPGIGRIIIDSEIEIARIDSAAASRDMIAPVMLRVKAGVSAHTHEYIATAHEDQKFGLSLTDGSLEKAVAKIMAAPNLRLLGFHSHIGSQIFATDGFAVAAEKLIATQISYAQQYQILLPELDLGGGFGIAYLPDDQPLSLPEMAESLAQIVHQACQKAGTTPPHISFEPGRAIIGPAGVTLYQIGVTKAVTTAENQQRTYVSVDGGMGDNARPVLYDANYHAELANRVSEYSEMDVRVVGKHCESGDILVRFGKLPADTAPGDLLAIAATGAYCRSLSSQYNAIPRPAMVAVKSGQTQLLLRRETISDLLNLEV